MMLHWRFADCSHPRCRTPERRRAHAACDIGAVGDDCRGGDAVAEFGRGIEIGRRDRGNAFALDRARIIFGTEGDARQDDQLLRSIVPFNIEAGIGLRIA